MTFFTLSEQQKKYVVDNLYNKYKRRNYIPERVMYFVDKHVGAWGFLCLKRGMPGMQFEWDYRNDGLGLTFTHLEIDEAAVRSHLDYIETKKSFSPIPENTYLTLKQLIS